MKAISVKLSEVHTDMVESLQKGIDATPEEIIAIMVELGGQMAMMCKVYPEVKEMMLSATRNHSVYDKADELIALINKMVEENVGFAQKQKKN